MAVGAATGALTGKLTDISISDDMIRRVGAELDHGKAAVFLLARSATVDRVADRLKPFRPTVIQSNLTKESEQELVSALQP